jgi:ribosomal protein S18 acetylase RimI-like enzyme
VTPTLVRGRKWPADVERLLDALPDWFGLPASNANFVAEAGDLPTVAALDGDTVVGACLVRDHNPDSAEIELLAVTPDRHRHGIGRALVDAVEADLRARAVRLLQVKTFGPSGDSEPYARTRAFYLALGFVPLEERTDIWGPENPCLILVKPLAVAGQLD